MPRNGAGQYTLPAGNPVVTGQIISSTTQNNTMNDVASALSSSISNDGQTPIIANLPMSGFKHTGAADGASPGDYATIRQLAASGADLIGVSHLVASMDKLRLLPKTGSGASIVEGYYSAGDGGGGSYVYVSSDTTSGAVITASTSGTTLTVAAVASGTLSVGQLISRSDTGAAVGYITALGTGSGGAGTYTLSASGAIASMTMMADNGGTIIVAADGGRWYRTTIEPLSVLYFGAKADGSTDATLPVQAAVNAAPDYATVLFPQGAFLLSKTVTVKPKITISGPGSISFTGTAVDCFSYTPGAPTGYPGRIQIHGLTINGSGGTSTCIKIDANAPFCEVVNCTITNFSKGIYLRDTYCSLIAENTISGCAHGIQLYREAHATKLSNNFVDSCTVAALSINYGGGAGTGPTHNISIIGGAYQNSVVGIWAEQALELHTINTYHEGNTTNDFVIGVADAGSYLRACYNVVIDGFSSSSPCASGRNFKIEHCVGVDVRAAAWNSGCSTTATLLSYDGFSDRVSVDVFRYTTTTPTTTAPVDFTSDTTRGVLKYKGRPIFSDNQTDAMQFGYLSSILGSIYQGYTSGGRHALTVKSFNQDLQFRAPELQRFQDSSGNDILQVDALNSLVVALKPLQMSGQTVGTTVGAAGGASALPATPLGYWTTKINGTTVRIPYYN